jgi:hypothetical protein
MAVDALRNFPSVLRPQIPEHEVRALCCREIGEPVDSAVLSNPVSRVHVVRMHLFGEPRLDGLFGCKKALLRLGYFEESSSGFLVRTRHPNGSDAQLDPADFMYFTDSKQVNKKVSAPGRLTCAIQRTRLPADGWVIRSLLSYGHSNSPWLVFLSSQSGRQKPQANLCANRGCLMVPTAIWRESSLAPVPFYLGILLRPCPLPNPQLRRQSRKTWRESSPRSPLT